MKVSEECMRWRIWRNGRSVVVVMKAPGAVVAVGEVGIDC